MYEWPSLRRNQMSTTSNQLAGDLMERSGSIQWVEDLCEQFDLVDEHGRRPPPYARRIK
jgi:hypothetical protein